MEFVDGHSCAELLRDEGRMGPGEAVDVLTQACRGLDYAHRNGVVHRDVKPGNLLRNREDVVKLADFGIAKAAEQSDITKVGSVLGTAAYLSPEQARGEPAGPAADLYALGVVAYQLLTGRLPYEAASLTDLARQQDAGPPIGPEALEPDVPPELSAAIMRALHPDPETRYGSAAAMERALFDGVRGVAPRGHGGDPGGRRRRRPPPTRMLEGTVGHLARCRARAPRAAGSSRCRSLRRPHRAARPPAPPAPARPHAARSPAATRSAGCSCSSSSWPSARAGCWSTSASDRSGDQVELNDQIEGDVNQSIDALEQLIEDNTR